MLRDGEPVLACGSPGGDQQDQWQLLFLLRHLVGGQSLQEAIDAPMWHTTSFPASFYPRDTEPAVLVVEDRLGAGVVDRARRAGPRRAALGGLDASAGCARSAGTRGPGCSPPARTRAGCRAMPSAAEPDRSGPRLPSPLGGGLLEVVERGGPRGVHVRGGGRLGRVGVTGLDGVDQADVLDPRVRGPVGGADPEDPVHVQVERSWRWRTASGCR